MHLDDHHHHHGGESASARFFSVPELVQKVLPHLARERVDLLALSLVSKPIRPLALCQWAQQLDHFLSEARQRFDLFEANPHLYSHVKRLRFINDFADHRLLPDPFVGRGGDRTPFFRSLRGLLFRLCSTANAQGVDPLLVDLTIVVEDSRHIPATLQTRIVALRILHTTRSIAEMMAARRARLIAQQEAEGQPNPETASTFPVGTWQDLVELTRRASHGPGLQTLHIHTDRAESAIFRDAVVKYHSRTLRDIACKYMRDDCFAPGLLTTTFPQLKRFHISAHNLDQVEVFNAFLDRNPGLIHLDLEITDTPDPGLSWEQTFPSLRSIRVKHPFPPQEFADRHQYVLSCIKYEAARFQQTPPTLTSSSDYAKLRHTAVHQLDTLKELVDQELPLLHIFLRDDKGSIKAHMHLLNAPNITAWPITCLELETTDVTLLNVMRDFNPASFPNLVEVPVHACGRYLREYGEVDAEGRMKRAIFNFYKAKKLKVLRITEMCYDCPEQDALIDFEFPPALEIFGWNSYYEEESGQYFRFVPILTQKGHLLGLEHGGKRGRLQRVPAVFRTRISPDGVWERPYKTKDGVTVLDHLGDVPTPRWELPQ
ncbi:hypothetical protein V8E36_005277 [Tilletia maclaganii]